MGGGKGLTVYGRWGRYLSILVPVVLKKYSGEGKFKAGGLFWLVFQQDRAYHIGDGWCDGVSMRLSVTLC